MRGCRDLAEEPRVDIDIVFTGARRGERLNEILFSGNEPVVDIGVDGVTAAQTSPVDRAAMARWLVELASAVEKGDRAASERVYSEAIPNFRGAASVTDLAAHRASFREISAPRHPASAPGGTGARGNGGREPPIPEGCPHGRQL